MLKSLDFVIVKYGSITELVILKRHRNQWLCNLSQPINGEATIITTKMSMGSKMRTIITYLAEPPTGEYLRNLMTNARGVLGYPGCGKSTQIGKMIGNNDVALAMNSEAVDSLARKASHTKAIVCSVEKATQLIKTNKANLFIDEATMIDYVMLAPIVKHGFTKLHIYGDNL